MADSSERIEEPSCDESEAHVWNPSGDPSDVVAVTLAAIDAAEAA